MAGIGARGGAACGGLEDKGLRQHHMSKDDMHEIRILCKVDNRIGNDGSEKLSETIWIVCLKTGLLTR